MCALGIEAHDLGEHLAVIPLEPQEHISGVGSRTQEKVGVGVGVGGLGGGHTNVGSPGSCGC